MKLEDIGSEFQGAALGDRNPGLSFPEATGTAGEAVSVLEQ
jgi:hypothetical protein